MKFAVWLGTLWVVCSAVLLGLMLLPPPLYEQVAEKIPQVVMDLLPHDRLSDWATRLRSH